MSLGKKDVDIVCEVLEHTLAGYDKEYYEKVSEAYPIEQYKLITIEPLNDKRWRIAGLC